MYEIYEKLLQKYNVTTYQVAKATGINQSTFSAWKTRRNLISSEKGQKIADYFGVTLGYLMGSETDEQKSKQTKKESLIEELDGVYLSLAKEAQECGLTAEDVETILETIKAVKRRRLKKEQENK